MSARLGVVFFLGLLSSALLRAQPTTFEQRVELLFRPPLAEQVALSPDGRRVAYTVQAGSELHVVILDVEAPGTKVRLNVDDARTVVFSKEKQHAQLRFLRWATPDRLVLAPTEVRIMLPALGSINTSSDGLPSVPAKTNYEPRITAPIMAVDATGLNPLTLAETAPDATRAMAILGFLRENREQLGVFPGEDNGLSTVDVRTGKQTALAERRRSEIGPSDGRMLVATESRHAVERELATKFPRRKIDLVDWSADLQHALVHVTGGNDPGRVFVYRRAQNLLTEILRDAPWLNSEMLNDSRSFEFAAPDGARLSAFVTWPRMLRLKPPPLLVIFPSGFPGHAQSSFDPEAQVFADLGFTVLRLNHRYVLTSRRDLPAGAALDRQSVADAAAAIAELARRFPDRPFDVKHVAALGRGFGGYLAVRALQLRPDAFRAGVAIDAPMNLRNWLFPARAGYEDRAASDIPASLFDSEGDELSKLAVEGDVASLTRPVFFLVEPTRNTAVDVSVGRVRDQLRALKRIADYLEVEPGFALGLPAARAAVYRRIGEFFNLNLYDYRVKIGPATEVK